MILYTCLFLVIIIVIDRFTTINLSPKLLFKRTKYKRFPELQDNLQWDNFSIDRITQTRSINIRYFPQKNFFLISNYKRLGYFNPIKIDSVGNQVFELNMDEKDSFKFLETINCFVIGADGIYDLSADDPHAIAFNEVLNKNRDIEPEKWIKIFKEMYHSSDIVLYGWHSDIEMAQAVYFYTEGKWIKLYDYQFIYSEGSKINCKIKGEKIPQKWQEEHYLKDVENAIYSNEHRFKDSYITPFNSDQSFFPDQQLQYSSAGILKTLAFSKETYTTEGYFNPGIPSTFYGTGYYSLNIDNNNLHFKATACKHNGIGETVQTDLHLFSLPAAFTKKSQLCFLTYDYRTNFWENEKKGVYVIKKKAILQ